MDDTAEKITALVNGGCWEEAVDVLREYLSAHSMDDRIALLASAVYFHYGMKDQERACIEKGLSVNPRNYELYFLLGDTYSGENPDLAYLCYENALYHCRQQQTRRGMPASGNGISQDGNALCGNAPPACCPDDGDGEAAEKKGHEDSEARAGEEDLRLIESRMSDLRSQGSVHVRPSTIVILSYNTLEYTRMCIESIRRTCPPEAYALVVVDNASSDGSREWLEAQTDIQLILNDKNKGFPIGCNQGIAFSAPENDIFLLNSDTVLPQNALFTLRMALYSGEKIGAVGSVSNYASNCQMVEEAIPDLEAGLRYGEKRNIPGGHVLEYRDWLVGYALLLKRPVLDAVGLLDARFSPGNCEDNDFCLRILEAGYRLALCHNSFIYHFGSKSFQQQGEEGFRGLYDQNREKFQAKWGFATQTVHKMLADNVQEPGDAAFKLLEIGCGTGSTLGYLQYRYPKAELTGLEQDERMALLGAVQWDVCHGDILSEDLPFQKASFDYILIWDLLEDCPDYALRLEKIMQYLKSDGRIFARGLAGK